MNSSTPKPFELTPAKSLDALSTGLSITAGAKATGLEIKADILRGQAQAASSESEALRFSAMDKNWSDPALLAASDTAADSARTLKGVSASTWGAAERTLGTVGKAATIVAAASTALTLGDKFGQSKETGDWSIFARGLGREAVVWTGTVLAGAGATAACEASIVGAPAGPLAGALAGTGANIGLNTFFDSRNPRW
jgi:hypothetical protein